MDLNSIPDNYKVKIQLFNERGEHIGEAALGADFMKARQVFYNESGLDFNLKSVWEQYVNGLPQEEKVKLLRSSFHFFYGTQNPESNFYHPIKFVVDGVEYNCSEQYFMYKKAVFFGDTEKAEKIMKATSPSAQKSLGRAVKPFDKQAWNSVSRRFMYEAVYYKFSQNPDLKTHLFKSIGKENVEASQSDDIWGIGLIESDPRAAIKSEWRGTNWLGIILDEVRDELIKGNEISKTRYVEHSR